MTHPLAYLMARGLVNAARRGARRLREPQYLVGVVAGVAWLAFLGVSRGRRALPVHATETAVALGAAGALLFAAWGWLFGAAGRALAFSPPETTWLLPAPLPRGALVNLKLLRVQGLVVANVVLWTLLVPGGSAGASLRRGVALWCLLSTLALHRIVAGVLRGTAASGSAGLRKAGAAAGGVLFALALLIATGTLAAPEATAWLERPLVRAVLWPFALLVSPVVQLEPAAWAAAIVPALALLLCHFVLVHVAEHVAEDAATVQALAHLDAGGAGASTVRSRSAPLVALAPRGSVALAIVWKNVTMLMRRRLLAWLAGGTLGAVLVVLLLERLSPVAAVWVGSFALTWSGFLLVTGPQFLRNDLRGDLEHLDLLRTVPIRGQMLLAAELLAPTLMLGAALAVLFVLAHLGLRHAEDAPLLLRQPSSLGGVLLATPGVAAIVMLVQNAGAVLYPGWTRLTGRSGSAAALGTNLLSVAATALAGGVLLLPAAWLARPLLEGHGSAHPLLAGAVVTLVALGEVAVLVWWLGGRVDRLEPREEVPG